MSLAKRKTAEENRKLSCYVPKEIAEIYARGKNNDWDVSGLARKALTEAFLKNKDLLLKRAEDVDSSSVAG